MGMTILLTKKDNTAWNKNAEKIAKAFVGLENFDELNYRVRVPCFDGFGNYKYKHETRTLKNRTFNGLDFSYDYTLENITFKKLGGSFGCRESLTSYVRNQNLDENRILLLRENLTQRSDRNLNKIKDGWTDFATEFLSYSNIDKSLCERLSLFNKETKLACFPLDVNKSLTYHTIASALVLIIRESSILTYRSAKVRNYYNLIKELRNDNLKVLKKIRASRKYTKHGYNYLLWHILHYLNLISNVESFNERPNGPSMFISSGQYHVAKIIKNIKDKKTKETFFELLGGENSPIINGFSSNITVAINELTGEKK